MGEGAAFDFGHDSNREEGDQQGRGPGNKKNLDRPFRFRRAIDAAGKPIDSQAQEEKERVENEKPPARAKAPRAKKHSF